MRRPAGYLPLTMLLKHAAEHLQYRNQHGLKILKQVPLQVKRTVGHLPLKKTTVGIQIHGLRKHGRYHLRYRNKQDLGILTQVAFQVKRQLATFLKKGTILIQMSICHGFLKHGRRHLNHRNKQELGVFRQVALQVKRPAGKEFVYRREYVMGFSTMGDFISTIWSSKILEFSNRWFFRWSDQHNISAQEDNTWYTDSCTAPRPQSLCQRQKATRKKLVSKGVRNPHITGLQAATKQLRKTMAYEWRDEARVEAARAKVDSFRRKKEAWDQGYRYWVARQVANYLCKNLGMVSSLSRNMEPSSSKCGAGAKKFLRVAGEGCVKSIQNNFLLMSAPDFFIHSMMIFGHDYLTSRWYTSWLNSHGLGTAPSLKPWRRTGCSDSCPEGLHYTVKVSLKERCQGLIWGTQLQVHIGIAMCDPWTFLC